MVRKVHKVDSELTGRPSPLIRSITDGRTTDLKEVRKPEPRFEIVLQAERGSPHPVYRRLALVLKRLLRSHGFRCISAREVEGEDMGGMGKGIY